MAVQRPVPDDLTAIAGQFHFSVPQERMPALQPWSRGSWLPTTGSTSSRSPSGSIVRVRAARPRPGQGQGRAGADLAGACRPRPAGRGCDRAARDAAQPELVAWRRGHCLSYGEAVGFWALGEIIKTQAGISESDHPLEVATKLDAASAPSPATPRSASG